MQIWPAIDLRGGKCVRLRQGDYHHETVFADDPAAMARQFVDARGAASAPRRSGRGPRGPAGQSAERPGDSRRGRHRVRAGRRHPRRAIGHRAARPRPVAAGDRHLGAYRARVVPPDVPQVSRQAGAGHRRPRRPGGDRRLAEDQRPSAAIDLARQFAGEPLAAIIYTDIATDGMLAARTSRRWPRCRRRSTCR